ncbi:MAG: KH domain-containing protein [Firmicutes bacterium]|nr:KH domain-containing protein [Bacillota bacterium]
MKELVEHIVRTLVNDPAAATVTETENEEGIFLLLKVAPEDMGKVIGKQGRIAKAIRVVLKAAGTREGRKVTLEIE